MCAHKFQRILMAAFLTLNIFLFKFGYMDIAVVLQSLIVIMLLVWAKTDFCFSVWVLEKLFGDCGQKRRKEDRIEAQDAKDKESGGDNEAV